MKKTQFLIAISFSITALTACTKIKIEKIIGEYSGDYHYYKSEGSDYEIDTTYRVTYIIEAVEKDIVILGRTIPYDLVKDGEIYSEAQSNNTFTLQIVDDSLFVDTEGGWEGYIRKTSFRGAKF